MSSDIEDDSISNLVIDQMNITEIADYIDLNCHESTTTPWTTELLFPSSFNGEEFKDQNILRYIDSKIINKQKKGALKVLKLTWIQQSTLPMRVMNLHISKPFLKIFVMHLCLVASI